MDWSFTILEPGSIFVILVLRKSHILFEIYKNRRKSI